MQVRLKQMWRGGVVYVCTVAIYLRSYVAAVVEGNL